MDANNFHLLSCFSKLSHGLKSLHTPTAPAASLNVCLDLMADRDGESECLYSLKGIMSLRVPESTCLSTFLFLATFLRFNIV